MTYRQPLSLVFVLGAALGCATQDTGNFEPLPQGGVGGVGATTPVDTAVAGTTGGTGVTPPVTNDPVGTELPVDMGGLAGAGGVGSPVDLGTAGTTVIPDPVDTVRPPCMSDPRQVMVAGDSYVNWVSHTFPQDLASQFGNGATGVWDVPYTLGGRLYAVGGWSMGSGGIGHIPDQLGYAVTDDPDIIAAVMTGGGNDFLVSSPEWPGGGECRNNPNSPPEQVCQDIINTAIDAARQLMKDSADAGIQDVVYFFYPNIPAPTLLGGSYPNVLLDWAYPKAQALCDEAEAETAGRLRCHFVDMRPVFEGHPEYFVAGDVHENAMGSAAMAKVIVQVMKDNCIAQPASSGCCAP